MQEYEGYYVTPCGKVWSYKSNQWMTPIDHHNGYQYVKLNNKMVGLHQAVATCWLERNNLPQVNHKDENRHNNKVSNLEWCTALYNNTYSQGKKIRDMDSGEVFDSIRAAARARHTSQNAIQYALKHSKNGAKHHFEYIN